MAKNRAVTIVDVARRCGVSVTTASHALGNSPRRRPVAAATVARIERAAKVLGYRPSWRGRALVQGKTNQIALLYSQQIPEIRGIFEKLIQTLTVRLREAGYHLLYLPVHDDNWAAIAGEGRFDACLHLDANTTAQVDRMLQAGVPSVLINGVDDPRCSRVLFDDVGGMRLAVEHLVNLGHRRIAYCWTRSQDADHASVSVRRQSFLSEMTRLNLKTSAVVCQDEAATILRDMPLGPKDISAIIGYADTDVIDVVSELHRRGLRVPQDVSVLGFNDVYPMERLYPGFTCINVPGSQMGAVAAQLLLNRLADPEAPVERLVIPENLVVRASTAALTK